MSTGCCFVRNVGCYVGGWLWYGVVVGFDHSYGGEVCLSTMADFRSVDVVWRDWLWQTLAMVWCGVVGCAGGSAAVREVAGW